MSEREGECVSLCVREKEREREKVCVRKRERQTYIAPVAPRGDGSAGER